MYPIVLVHSGRSYEFLNTRSSNTQLVYLLWDSGYYVYYPIEEDKHNTLVVLLSVIDTPVVTLAILILIVVTIVIVWEIVVIIGYETTSLV